MLWFNKKKDKENRFLKEFNDRFKPEYLTDYQEVKDAYEEISKYYKKEVEAGRIDIKLERIRVEKNIGLYNGFFTNIGIAFIIGITGGLFPLLVQELIKIPDINFPLVNIITILITMVGLTLLIISDINKDKPKDIMYKICLKVLDDFDDENDSINSNIAKDEVATTVQEEPLKEPVKHISNQNNGNWNISISETSILTMISSIYKTGKFVGRIFRKKKR